MRYRLLVALLALMVPVSAAAATGPARWLHVTVEETGEGAESVRVHLPLDFLQRVLPLIEHEALQEGRVRVLEDLEVRGIDLREIWSAMSDLPDGEYVTVEGADESVRVAKQAGHLLVRVAEDSEQEETVQVTVPLGVVDALFSSGPGELDVAAALRALAAHGESELVRVRDGATNVRVWVDASQTGP